MLSAEVVERLRARVLAKPLLLIMEVDVVMIVFEQFEVAAPCYSQEFEFRLHRGLPIGASLGNVLLGASCCLHHLVHGTVASLRKETLAEGLGKMIQHLTTLIESNSVNTTFLRNTLAVPSA